MAKTKIGFIIPWFGENIGGGAEAECRQWVHAIQKVFPDKYEVTVFTTCLKEFAADWNANIYPEGVRYENGVRVHRFFADPIDRTAFASLNRFRLEPRYFNDIEPNGNPRRSPLTAYEEELYLSYMVHSASLYKFLQKNQAAQDLYFLLPYMFGITVQAARILQKRCVWIPCLHLERYAFMNTYKNVAQRVGGVLFHAQAEQRLFRKLYPQANAHAQVVGEIVDCDQPTGDPQRFRRKFLKDAPFIIYVGRKIAGKNLPLLADHHVRMVKENPDLADVKLVLLGSGDLRYPAEEFPAICDLGFVSAEDKRDAVAAALALCQPSENESFSIVMMESWLQGRPVIVNQECEVTADHVAACDGGFTFASYEDYVKAVRTLKSNASASANMGEQGRNYVHANYSRNVVLQKLDRFITTNLHVREQGSTL